MGDVLRVLESQPYVSAPSGGLWKCASRQEPDDDGLCERVADLLSPAPTSIDALARLAGAPVAGVLAALTELTVAGRAEMLPGRLGDEPRARLTLTEPRGVATFRPLAAATAGVYEKAPTCT